METMWFVSGFLVGAVIALIAREWLAIRRVRHWLHHTEAGQRFLEWTRQ